eukprot:11184667-Lingulodinium_polyedra.AAC.1
MLCVWVATRWITRAWLRATLHCGQFSSVAWTAPSRTIVGGRPRLEYQLAVWGSGSPDAWR